MVDTGIMCSGSHVVKKAGALASATSTAEAYTNIFIAEAESFINVASKKNWSDVYSSLNVDVKYILTEAVSNLAAIYAIQYDMQTGFVSKITAEDQINILRDRAMQCIGMLTDPGRVDFMVGA